ncbi:LOB domain-containing protein 15-like [Phoenix dactylifera]|uniref:LOB domain-containing protein 15-like n=1 Tax=Phoenix dactylifera TaxID=42345 RepID=A0A8B7D085_PHODC|nr:LOB domain-containing protein 15-like [Phoenix dactylifera]
MSTERERFDEVGKKIKRETDDTTDRMGRRLGPVGTLNTITPCAACKLLRRRCAQECPFSPYFPPHEPQKFASVHKVFGASNVSKMLMEVPEAQRADAANSLVYEANMRLGDPVYGCMGAVSGLQQQVQALEAELRMVRAEILKHKCRQASVHVLPTSHAALLAPSGDVSVAAPPRPASSASSSSIYTTPPSTSSTDYSSINPNGNVAFFG